MSRLVRTSSDGQRQSLELHEGVNRIGRSADNEFTVDEDTISAHHCEVHLKGGTVTVRDLNSTNGTSINGEALDGQTGPLGPGESLVLGSVHFTLEEIKIQIPDLKPSQLKHTLPIGAEDPCRNHEDRPSIWFCTQCGLHFCNACVHHMRRVGGKFLNLCPECSYPCRLLESALPKRKKSKLAWLKNLLPSSGKKKRTKSGKKRPRPE